MIAKLRSYVAALMMLMASQHRFSRLGGLLNTLEINSAQEDSWRSDWVDFLAVPNHIRHSQQSHQVRERLSQVKPTSLVSPLHGPYSPACMLPSFHQTRMGRLPGYRPQDRLLQLPLPCRRQWHQLHQIHLHPINDINESAIVISSKQGQDSNCKGILSPWSLQGTHRQGGTIGPHPSHIDIHSMMQDPGSSNGSFPNDWSASQD